MKRKLLIAVIATVLFIQKNSFGQAPVMGTTIDYVLFTSAGAIGNTGVSHITGNIGTEVGAITAFGNVDGVVNAANPSTATAAADLALLYTQLSTTATTDAHGAVLGAGEVLSPGVYQIAAAGSIAGTLTLDAGGDENALFIFKIGGAFTTGSATEVVLANNASACNVFWVAEGAIGMAAGTTMKGTLIANNAAIAIAAGGQLDGRMFSTFGAIAIDGTTARIPLGCGLPVLSGPEAPSLASVECFALFSGNGALTNTGMSLVTGDIGTNAGATTGFVSGDVDGIIHLAPDAVTATCATDLDVAASDLNALIVDIELLYPATLGNKLVLTPHTYLLNAATVIADTLFLNAQNNTDAVFVLTVIGELSTSVNATITLMNGAQAKNVFWMVNGNVSINADANFLGTIISDGGSISMAMGSELNGRALTTNGIFSTDNTTVTVPTICSLAGVEELVDSNKSAVYPNPCSSYFNVDLNTSIESNNVQVSVYNLVGDLIITKALNKQSNRIDTLGIPAGVYLYKLCDKNGTLQTGRLIAQ